MEALLKGAGIDMAFKGELCIYHKAFAANVQNDAKLFPLGVISCRVIMSALLVEYLNGNNCIPDI